MADKRISQLVERTDIANNDVLPIVASGATTTNKVTVSTLQDWMQENLDVGVTSVGLSMPSAFTVTNSPVTTSGNISVTGAGTVSQYIRGDGTLADFPSSTGGGSSVSYYLNGSVSQGTIGGIAYLEMNKVPVLGSGTDFTINANGYIASFITDAGDPALLEIPGGNWNFETYFSASSGGGTPSFYVELYKVNSGGTATLIASNSTNPELIAFGTTTTSYFSSLAVPTTTLALTDRLALRYYVNHSGRTITLHTEDNNLCQVITTFTTGLTALNGLTAQVQNLATGTSGSDFNIVSSGTTHTFNLPDASTSARGVVTTGAQNFAGNKSFQNTIFVNAGLRLDQNGTALPTFVQNISGTGLISSGSNGLGFNNSNNLYFSGSDKGGAVFAVNNTAVRTYTLQDANGTLAFTSDISSAVAGYLPLTGGTLTGPLYGQSASFSSAGSSFISIVKTGGVSLNLNAVGTAASIATSTNHDLEFYRNNILVAKFTTGSVTTLYGALNGTSGNFSGDLQTGTRVIAASGGASIIIQPNVSGGGSLNRIEGSAGTPMHIVTNGSSLAFGAGGTTPQVIINNVGNLSAPSASFSGGTGAINFTNSTTITNTASSGFTAIYANGGGVYLGGSASTNHLSILSTGAATFSSSVTAGGEYYLSVNNSYLRGRNSANTAYIAAIGINGSNKVAIDPDNNGSVFGGAATFSSSVTAGDLISTSYGNARIQVTSTTNSANSGFRLGAKDSSGTTKNAGLYYIAGTTTANTYLALFADDNNPQLTVLANGNVGIGTPSPVAELHVVNASGSNQATLELQQQNSGSNILQWRGSAGTYLGVISDSGNVGIGTTSPTAKIHAVDNANGFVARFTGGASSNVLGGFYAHSGLGFASMGVQSAHAFRIFTTDADRFEVAAGGAVTVYNLGTGIVYSNGGTLTSTNPSDERLKDNIEDINWGLDEILKLRPVSYTWKNDTINQGTQFGFIAQEVQEVIPEAVKEFGEEEIYLGLEKEAIYVTLIKAIQELKAEIDSLKTK